MTAETPLATFALQTLQLTAIVFGPLLLLNVVFRLGYFYGLLPSASPDVVHQALISLLFGIVFFNPRAASAPAVQVELRQARPEEKEAVVAAAEPVVGGPAEPVEVEENDPDAVYLDKVPALVQNFLRLSHSDPATDPTSPWTLFKTIETTPRIWVYQNTSSQLSFKMVAELDAEPIEAFDVLADTTGRADYDEMTAEAKVVEVLDARTRIVYLRTKPIFPVSARDLVSISHITVVTDSEKGITTYVNVTTSVEHPAMPPQPSAVRMSAGIAGQMVSPLLDELGVPINGRCKVIQLVDGDLGGSVPAWLVSKVAGQTIPGTLQKLNKFLLEQAKTRAGPRVPNFVENGFEVSPAKAQLALRRKAAPVGDKAPAAAAATPAARANGHAAPVAKKPVPEKKMPPNPAVDLSGVQQITDYLPALGFSAAALTIAAFVARRVIEE